MPRRSVRGLLALVVLPALVLAPGAEAAPSAWVPTLVHSSSGHEQVEVTRDRTAWLVVDQRALATSADTGRTWSLTTPVPGTESNLHVAPVSSEDALAARQHAYWRTSDGGSTWQPVTVPNVSPKGQEAVNLLRRTGGRFWVGELGVRDGESCTQPLDTTPLLSSADGVHWTRADLPVEGSTPRQLSFADSRHGALTVYDFSFTYSQSATGCHFLGVATDELLFTTDDGGRSWVKRMRCTGGCSIAWASSPRRTLVVAGWYGWVKQSTDDGRTFRAGASGLPTHGGVSTVECFLDRCWAYGWGSGVYRSDRGGAWQGEPAPTAELPTAEASLAAFDREHVVAAAPYVVLTRLGDAPPQAARDQRPRHAQRRFEVDESGLVQVSEHLSRLG